MGLSDGNWGAKGDYRSLDLRLVGPELGRRFTRVCEGCRKDAFLGNLSLILVLHPGSAKLA